MEPSPSQDATAIVPRGWNADVAARFGYSFAVRADGHLWIAGQVAMDESGRPVAVGDIEAQTRCVFERISEVVEAGGSTMDRVVRTTTYITDPAFRPVTNELRTRYFEGPTYPTNTLVVVAALALPEYLVEIDAVATVPG